MEQTLSALRRSAWLYGILLITTGLSIRSPGQNPAGKPPNSPLPDANSTLRLEVTEPRGVAVSREVHYGFPRLVRAKNGDLLLFYRVGTTHARDYSAIAMRTSGDDGASWSPERILHRDPDKRRSAHNPVALVTRSGRVLLWTSSFGFQERPRRKTAAIGLGRMITARRGQSSPCSTLTRREAPTMSPTLFSQAKGF